MSRVVYLHVGAPKTGTTYLQDRLALNKTSLGEHGVHYPPAAARQPVPSALDLLPAVGRAACRRRGRVGRPRPRVKRLSGSVVVSHEILAAAKTAQVKRALSSLGDSEVHLVYSARDLARQIPAEWQEGVKHQRKIRFGGFLQQVRNPNGPSRRCGSGGCRASPTC